MSSTLLEPPLEGKNGSVALAQLWFTLVQRQKCEKIVCEASETHVPSSVMADPPGVHTGGQFTTITVPNGNQGL